MRELFHRFQLLSEEYDSLKRRCDGNVSTWRWTKYPKHDPRPFWYERNRWKSGSFLKTPPARPNGYYEYGYDSTGNLLIARNYVDKDSFYETFHIRHQDSIEEAHFNYHLDKEPIYFSSSSYQENQIILWESCARYGSMRERYIWDKNRVTVIEVEYSQHNSAEFVEPMPWQKVEISYTNRGLLDKVIVHWQKHAEQRQELTDVAYRRLEKAQTFGSLLSIAKQRLYDAIARTITRLELQEEVYCIAVTWSPGQYQSLPPHLGIGFNRDREKWIAEHGKEEARWYMWNPAEFSFQIIDQTVFSDSELIQVCELLNQECGRHSNWHETSRMLSEVAKMLNQTNWHGILRTTDDFMAYATNYELSDWQKYLRLSISKELFAHLKDKGWLI